MIASSGGYQRIFVALLLCFSAIVALPLHAQVPAPSADRAAFSVLVIEATKAPVPRIDPRLNDLKTQLAALHRDFNVFSLVREQTLTLATGGRGVVKLLGTAEFSIEFLGFTPGNVQRARHKVTMPGVTMTRSVAPGGRTLDVVPGSDRLTVIATTVGKSPEIKLL